MDMVMYGAIVGLIEEALAGAGALKGKDGETPQFRMSGNTLQYRFPTNPPTDWTDLYTFTGGGGGGGDVFLAANNDFTGRNTFEFEQMFEGIFATSAIQAQWLIPENLVFFPDTSLGFFNRRTQPWENKVEGRINELNVLDKLRLGDKDVATQEYVDAAIGGAINAAY